MAEMTDFEKRRASEAAAKAESESKKQPKKKKKKELTPEEKAAAVEQERKLVKSFYLRKWEEVKKRSTLFVGYLEEGFPGAEFQPPVKDTEMSPFFSAVVQTPLVGFQAATEALCSQPGLRKDDIRRYAAGAQRYSEFLVAKSTGASAANLPPLPGTQPRKKVELRSRLIMEYIIVKSAEKNTLQREGTAGADTTGTSSVGGGRGSSTEPSTMDGTQDPPIGPGDEVSALNLWTVEWLPLRDIQKLDKPKEKGEIVYSTCTNPKCETKYMLKTFFKCGGCGAKYCTVECQKEDWKAHTGEFHCDATLSKELNRMLKRREWRRMASTWPYVKLLLWTLSKLTPFEGYLWYAMAYLRDSDWAQYAMLVPKDKDEKKQRSSEGGDVFTWSCFTSCVVNRNRAESLFAKKEVARAPRVLFEIKTIEAYKISQYVEPPEPGGSSSSATSESADRDEVLLPPGSTFRVLMSTTTGTLLHLVLEQIPQPYSNSSSGGSGAEAAGSSA